VIQNVVGFLLVIVKQSQIIVYCHINQIKLVVLLLFHRAM
jgi:hypothetical protein